MAVFIKEVWVSRYSISKHLKLIPLNIPHVPKASTQYVLESLRSRHQQGDGPFTVRASKSISELVGGGHVLLTPSCTHALEMASILADIGPGDEVILPSYTFTSAAVAVTKFGGTPVFVDIDSETKGIDAYQVRAAITPRTKAISWVNYAGVAPDIENLKLLAKEFDLLLIEDNAHGLGGTYNGNKLGSFGDFATQSFHATKNIQCGEGGALVINNPKYIERAEIIREKGTDRTRFIRGEINKYQWVDKGSSYLLADSLAAILLGQLENFEEIQKERQFIFDTYVNGLAGWGRENGFDLPFIYPGESHTAHMFYLIADKPEKRESLIDKLHNSGIQALFHYQSLAHSKEGARFAGDLSNYRNSQRMTNQLVRLPIFFQLGLENAEKIVKSVIS